jgi:sugar phosphate permease
MDSTFEAQTIRRVYWRIVPLLFAMMFFNYLDRINIGFAALRMNHDIGLDPSAFGFGASIFFVGYMTLEIPSNLMLHRLGARRWIARILITWGAVAAAMAFVWNAGSFYALRFGVGVMEAGFLPGVAYYLTAWFPERYRARAVGGYIIAGSFSAVLGGPISTAVMMFIAEGVPTILLGVFVLYYMTERPADAQWLTPEQRVWLEETLQAERAELVQPPGSLFREVAGDLRAWLLAALFGCALVGVYGLFLWLPQIVKSLGNLTDIEVGFLSALPPLLGVLGTILVSRSSDRTGDRKKHLAFVYAVSAVGLVGSAFAPNPVLAFVMLCVTGTCIYAGNPLFWSLAASFKTGAAGAATIALINTVAQLGGVIGPWTIGLVRSYTGSFQAALLTIAGFLSIAVVIALTMRVTPRTVPSYREKIGSMS